MEKLHELSQTTVLRSRDPAHSRVLTPEKSVYQANGHPVLNFRTGLFVAEGDHGIHAHGARCSLVPSLLCF